MVGHLAAGHALAVLHLMTKVLEALELGESARNHWCAGVGALLDCKEVGHAWLDDSAVWSLCLWREVREGARSLTLTQPEDLGPGGGVTWSTSTCRRIVLDWVALPYLAEVPLTVAAPHQSVLVLGRERPFGLEDTRRVEATLHHLVLLEHLVLRSQPPTRQTPGLFLTPREQMVLLLLSQGLLARSIAQRMNVSERTVHKHLGNLYRKLDVHDRLVAVSRGQALGLIPPSPAGVAQEARLGTAGVAEPSGW